MPVDNPNENLPPRLVARVFHPVGGEPKTRQEFKDSTTVQNAVDRYARPAVWDRMGPVVPRYGDDSGARNMADAYLLVKEADEAFETLPAKIREAADNRPELYYEMLTTQEGVDALQAAGAEILDSEKAQAIRRRQDVSEAVADLLSAFPSKGGDQPTAPSSEPSAAPPSEPSGVHNGE